MATYMETDLFLYGLDKAGTCPTRNGFIDALRADTYDAGGLLPAPVDLTKGFGRTTLCYTFMKVNDTGTAYDVVPDLAAAPADRNRRCGHRLGLAS